MIDSLPCLVCRKMLARVTDDSEGQPDEGVMLTSHGNYGSTVYDPMNGNFLLFNLCDDCLVAKGEEGAVLSARARIPVLTDTVIDMGSGRKAIKTTVGAHECERIYVQWTVDTGTDDRTEYIPIDEIALYLDKDGYDFHLKAEHFQSMLSEYERFAK